MKIVQRDNKFGLKRGLCEVIFDFDKDRFLDLTSYLRHGSIGYLSDRSYHFEEGCWSTLDTVYRIVASIEADKKAKKELKKTNKIKFVDYALPSFCDRVVLRLKKLAGFNRSNSGIVANG